MKWGISKQTTFFQSSEQTPWTHGCCSLPGWTRTRRPPLHLLTAEPTLMLLKRLHGSVGLPEYQHKAAPGSHSLPRPRRAQAQSRGSLGQRAGKRQLPALPGRPRVSVGLLNSRCMLLASCSPPVLWTFVSKQIFLPPAP